MGVREGLWKSSEIIGSFVGHDEETGSFATTAGAPELWGGWKGKEGAPISVERTRGGSGYHGVGQKLGRTL